MSHEKLSSIALVSYTLLGDFEIHSGHGLERQKLKPDILRIPESQSLILKGKAYANKVIQDEPDLREDYSKTSKIETSIFRNTC